MVSKMMGWFGMPVVHIKFSFTALRVEILLKTDGGYPREVTVHLCFGMPLVHIKCTMSRLLKIIGLFGKRVL